MTEREASGTSAPEDTEAEQVYTLVPVDRYGDSKDSCLPLTDKGIHYDYASIHLFKDNVSYHIL